MDEKKMNFAEELHATQVAKAREKAKMVEAKNAHDQLVRQAEEHQRLIDRRAAISQEVDRTIKNYGPQLIKLVKDEDFNHNAVVITAIDEWIPDCVKPLIDDLTNNGLEALVIHGNDVFCVTGGELNPSGSIDHTNTRELSYNGKKAGWQLATNKGSCWFDVSDMKTHSRKWLIVAKWKHKYAE